MNIETNFIKLKEHSESLCVPSGSFNMISVGTNTKLQTYSIKQKGGDPDAKSIESEIPILCKGLACDSQGNIWVHNSNLGTLTKINSQNLENLSEFEGSSDVHIGTDFKSPE